jgi:hypothetical protein
LDPRFIWAPLLTRIPDTTKEITYDAATKTLHIADGAIEGVSENVWQFEVSGMQVIKKWLGYRTHKGTGKAASSSSPLDQIRPDEWSPDWSHELLELLTVLSRTLELIPVGVELLDRICSGPLISAAELPEVPEELRKPPAASWHEGQAALDTT